MVLVFYEQFFEVFKQNNQALPLILGQQMGHDLSSNQINIEFLCGTTLASVKQRTFNTADIVNFYEKLSLGLLYFATFSSTVLFNVDPNI